VDGGQKTSFAASLLKRRVDDSSAGGVIVPLELNASRGHRGVAAHEPESVS